MGSTYLARIASLCTEIAVKVAAGSTEEGVLAKDRGSSADLQSNRAKWLRNQRNGAANNIPQRHTALQSWGSSACEVQLGSVPSDDDWAEIANFKAELETLRLRMIDACLRGCVCAAEPMRALIDRASNADTTSQQMVRGSLTCAVEGEVASAVRLLVDSENNGRRK